MPNKVLTADAANQTPELADVDLFTLDQTLRAATASNGGGHAHARLAAFGRACGSAEAIENGRLANEHPPRLRTHDAKGHRLDRVDFHPAYHACMRTSMAEGLHAMAWDHLAQAGVPAPAAINVVRAGTLFLAAQMEAGHCCPLTMTNAAVATLQLQPELLAQWLPRIIGRTYDPRSLPAGDKSSVTIGMGMTERQGGTDVRANTSQAVANGTGGPGGAYRLSGHKWFMSAPMSDAFLMLAQAPGGLSCFLVPRLRPDGASNGLQFQRLKEKLGNRSNASSEVEFVEAEGWLIGAEGRGVPAIIEMVTATRLDCAVSSAGLMRRAVVEALHHARHRRVFGTTLVDQALMRSVLADLALDSAAATALVIRLARSFDQKEDPRAAAWRRVMTPVTKYWVCKVAPALVYEAMECLGGNGYVEESLLPRLYREVPVNAIWEGSGNVMALDVLRVVQRDPLAIDVVLRDIAVAAGGDPGVDRMLAHVRAVLKDSDRLEARARDLVESLALAAAAAALRAGTDQVMADGFIAARLADGVRRTYGQGIEKVDALGIIERTLPA